MTQNEIESFWKLGTVIASGNAEKGSPAEAMYESLKAKMIEDISHSYAEESSSVESMSLDVAFNTIVSCLNEYMAILNKAVEMNSLSMNEFDEKSNMLGMALNVFKEKINSPKVNNDPEI